VFGDYVAIIWYVRPFAYLMLLRKSDEQNVRELAIDERYPYNCISIDDRLYIAGSPFYVLDADLRVLAKIDDEYTSLAYDGRALYLAGSGWRIEKRDPDNLTLIAAKELHLNMSSGTPYDVGVDLSTGRIWVVGYYKDSNGKIHSLIVILDEDLNVAKTIDYPRGSEEYLGVLRGVAFGGNHVYVVGEGVTAKFSPDGELIGVARAEPKCLVCGEVGLKIAYGYGYVFVIAAETYWGDQESLVLKIFDANLNIVGNTTLSSRYETFMDVGRPALDGNMLYVAGHLYNTSDPGNWITVYALKLAGPGIPEQTVAGGNRFAEYAKTAAKLLTAAVAVPSAGIVLFSDWEVDTESTPQAARRESRISNGSKRSIRRSSTWADPRAET